MIGLLLRLQACSLDIACSSWWNQHQPLSEVGDQSLAKSKASHTVWVMSASMLVIQVYQHKVIISHGMGENQHSRLFSLVKSNRLMKFVCRLMCRVWALAHFVWGQALKAMSYTTFAWMRMLVQAKGDPCCISPACRWWPVPVLCERFYWKLIVIKWCMSTCKRGNWHRQYRVKGV